MPAWVAERIHNYPQTPEGNALRDPLPVPFAATEVRDALLEVWRASHQLNDRRCADVSAAPVQIAMLVLPVLQSRNGGWIDFSGRPYNPLVNTPGSNVGRGVNLGCILAQLAGKPVPTIFGCNATPPHPSHTYSIRDVATTFQGPNPHEEEQGAFRVRGAFDLQPGRTAGPRIGAGFESESLGARSEPGLPLFDLVAAFSAHE